MVGERLGGAEDAEQPVPEGLGGEQGGGERLALLVGLGLDEPDQSAQGEVGVGGRAERVEEDGVVAQGGELGRSSSRSAPDGSVKPCRSRRLKVLLLRPAPPSFRRSLHHRRGSSELRDRAYPQGGAGRPGASTTQPPQTGPCS